MMKLKFDPGDCFAFYSSSSSFCLLSFSAVQAQENILYLAKFAICYQLQINSGSLLVANWPRSCFNALFGSSCGEFLLPALQWPISRTEGKCLCS